jgi:hypothetical protein
MLQRSTPHVRAQPGSVKNGNGHKPRRRRPPLTSTALTGTVLTSLCAQLRNNPAWLALLTVDIAAGRMPVSDLTRAQARKLTGASVGYTATAARLTPEERKKVNDGVATFAEFHNRPRQITDADLDRFVIRVGAGRVMAALDRHTSPDLPLVAAE